METSYCWLWLETRRWLRLKSASCRLESILELWLLLFLLHELIHLTHLLLCLLLLVHVLLLKSAKRVQIWLETLSSLRLSLLLLLRLVQISDCVNVDTWLLG